MKTCDVCQTNFPDEQIVDRGEYLVCHECIDAAVLAAVCGIDPADENPEEIPAIIAEDLAADNGVFTDESNDE